MKLSPGILGGIGALGLAGVGYLLVGILQPGLLVFPELAAGKNKSLLMEASAKFDGLQKKQNDLTSDLRNLQILSGQEGEHRVFVSPILVYLPANKEPVQPLDRKMKTADGIEIGWKMKFGFDPADPTVASQDPDSDGFINLEEYTANPSTDPLRKEDSPAKESKLKSRSRETVPMIISFVEKSGADLGIRFQVGQKRVDFKGKPGEAFWVMAGPKTVSVLREKSKVDGEISKLKEAGQNTHVIPLQVLSYLSKVEKVKDLKAGGIEIDVDNSSLVLQRNDAARTQTELFFSVPTSPKSVSWDVGDILFFTPSSGGMELGPFRIGEVFAFAGKQFAILGREGTKIQLLELGDGNKKPFWVPPDTIATPNKALSVP
ncbi:MAG: hypothetical protein EBT57_07680 [Verrucomicrobia bacterium]|nr:hypothetical protein [Verrucomicrobiota bacterium]